MLRAALGVGRDGTNGPAADGAAAEHMHGVLDAAVAGVRVDQQRQDRAHANHGRRGAGLGRAAGGAPRLVGAGAPRVQGVVGDRGLALQA